MSTEKLPWCKYDWRTKFFRSFSFCTPYKFTKTFINLEHCVCLSVCLSVCYYKIQHRLKHLKNTHPSVSLLLKRVELFQFWVKAEHYKRNSACRPTRIFACISSFLSCKSNAFYRNKHFFKWHFREIWISCM
jgi:hypothetical protein